jgi:hypothetical protein
MTTGSIAHFRDSVEPQTIGTSTVDGVIAYANGRYAWDASDIARFIEAGRKVHKYDVNGLGVQIADVLDVERFDATPEMIPGWVDERWATHSTAAVYCSRVNVPEVIEELAGRPCYLVVADWTGVPHLPVLDLPPRVEIAAVQYASHIYDDLAVYSRGWLEGVRL